METRDIGPVFVMTGATPNTDRWLHLRTCQECGTARCFDDSPNRHVTVHARDHLDLVVDFLRYYGSPQVMGPMALEVGEVAVSVSNVPSPLRSH